MLNYYDGIFLAPEDGDRITKWMNFALNVYDDGVVYKDTKRTKRSELIDKVIYNLYRHTCCYPYFKSNDKWHKKKGEIYVYVYKGVVYPKGTWVPKHREMEVYHRVTTMNPKPKARYVQKERYSYKTLRYEMTKRFEVSEDDYNSKLSAKDLFLKYNNDVSTSN